jgi:hypothetical protein
MKKSDYENSGCMECRVLAQSPYTEALRQTWNKHIWGDHADEIICKICGRWIEDTTIDDHYRAHDPTRLNVLENA